AYLGLGAVWEMGLSSSAAQLQDNPASMPPGLVEVTGVLPFTQTILLPQSIALTAVLVLASLLVCWLTAPTGAAARIAARRMAGIQPAADRAAVAARLRLAVAG